MCCTKVFSACGRVLSDCIICGGRRGGNEGESVGYCVVVTENPRVREGGLWLHDLFIYVLHQGIQRVLHLRAGGRGEGVVIFVQYPLC